MVPGTGRDTVDTSARGLSCLSSFESKASRPRWTETRCPGRSSDAGDAGGSLQEGHHQADVASPDEPAFGPGRQRAVHNPARHRRREAAQRVDRRFDPSTLLDDAVLPRTLGRGADHRRRRCQVSRCVGEDVDDGPLILTLQQRKKFVPDAIAGNLTSRFDASSRQLCP